MTWHVLSSVANPFASILRSLLLAVTALLAATSLAQAKRVALVIGNSNYEHAGKLANPTNDATDMAAALTELGFTVVTGIDLDNRGMRGKLREFTQELRGADTAMVFYAGHAIQVGAKNYLAPVDTRLEYESDVDFETISMDFIVEQMQREVDTILIFLDACRDNPLTRSLQVASRSGGTGKGLVETKLSVAGTFLAFATDPGKVALDGKGRNSPFTGALLRNIKRPGVEISTMMTDVRVQVREETGGAQTPWTNSSLLGHFFFAPKAEDQQVAALGATPSAPVVNQQAPAPVDNEGARKVDEARVAALAWEAVEKSNSEADLEFFINTFGNTFYAGLAKNRLERLRAEKAKAETTAASAEAPQAQPQPAAEPTKTVERTAADPAKATETVAAAPVEAKPAEPAANGEQIQVAALPEAKEAARSVDPAFDQREVALAIQRRLADLGCSPGRPDGLWGKRSDGALQSFSRSSKVKLVSLDPTPDLLDQLRRHDGRGCAPSCSATQELVGGQCVAKACPAGQQLSSKGTCFTPRNREAKAEPAPTRTTAPAPKTCPEGQLLSRKGKCYTPRREARGEPPMPNQKVCPQGMLLSSRNVCYRPRNPAPGQVVIQQGPVIVEQQPVIVHREPPPGPGPGLGVAIGIGSCLLVGC